MTVLGCIGSTSLVPLSLRRLAREEGLFPGASTGANVVAALAVGERLGREATVCATLA